MRHDVRDDDLMRRFLLGDVTVEEQERVEQAFVDDETYFEALCAVESELMLQYIRHELPDAWRERFESRILAVPARRRRVEDMRRLVSVLAETDRTGEPASRAPAVAPSWWARWGIVLGGAAAIITLVVGERLLRRPQTAPADSITAREEVAVQAPAVTFFLEAGQTRSAPQTNVFASTGARDVRLEFVVPLAAVPMPQATLRPVGGSPVPVASAPLVRNTRDGSVTVTWLVPGRALRAGDYLVTLTGEVATGRREIVASRFFSVVE